MGKVGLLLALVLIVPSAAIGQDCCQCGAIACGPASEDCGSCTFVPSAICDGTSGHCVPLTPTPTATATCTPSATASPSPSNTPTPALTLSGFVRDAAGKGMNGVTIDAQGAARGSNTTEGGSYGFQCRGATPFRGCDRIQQGELVTIQPSYNSSPRSQVSGLDAAYAFQAALEARTLSPHQQLACDVTGNGSVSLADVQAILEYRVGLRSQLPVTERCGFEWLFFPASAPSHWVTSQPPMISSQACTDGQFLIQGYPNSTNISSLNFDALAFGDCAPSQVVP